MGNTECQRCLSAEREMFGEILLGTNRSNKNTIDNSNTNYINNNIKKIPENMPQEILTNKKAENTYHNISNNNQKNGKFKRK